MKKFFKEYHTYLVYAVFLIYAIWGFEGTDDDFNSFILKNIKEILTLLLLVSMLLIDYLISRFSVAVQENKFLDFLQTDLESDRNQLFIQVRDTKVPFVDGNILKSISEAVLSKDWWDFSYLVKSPELVSEIRKSFSGNNEAASLTVFKKYPLSENYIFIGTIQNSSAEDFPNKVILNPSAESNYKLEFDRLFIYKQQKKVFGKGHTHSFKLIEENEKIADIFKKTMNKLRKNLDEGNSLHANWSKNGTLSLPNSCLTFNDFLDEVDKL